MSERPYLNISSPARYNYAAGEEEVLIYSSFVKFSEDDDEADDYCRRRSLNRRQPKIPTDDINHVNLQSILDTLPSGVEPKDVKIRMDIDAGCMSINGCYIDFYYIKTFQDEPEAYAKDKAEYDAAYAEWSIKYKAWEDENTANQIAKLESELKRLKG